MLSVMTTPSTSNLPHYQSSGDLHRRTIPSMNVHPNHYNTNPAFPPILVNAQTTPNNAIPAIHYTVGNQNTRPQTHQLSLSQSPSFSSSTQILVNPPAPSLAQSPTHNSMHIAHPSQNPGLSSQPSEPNYSPNGISKLPRFSPGIPPMVYYDSSAQIQNQNHPQSHTQPIEAQHMHSNNSYSFLLQNPNSYSYYAPYQPVQRPPTYYSIYSPSLHPTKSKQSTTWSPKEDKLLRQLKEVQKLGWREISNFFQGRTPNACQFRWRRIVSAPSITNASTSGKKVSHHSIKFLLN